MPRERAARQCGNITTPKTSIRKDVSSLPEYECGTRSAAWVLFGMFVFFAVWMVIAW